MDAVARVESVGLPLTLPHERFVGDRPMVHSCLLPAWANQVGHTDKPARLTPGCWRWRSASHIWLGESAAGFINGTPPMSRKGANVQSRIPEERGHGAGRSPVHLGPRGRRSRNALACCHVLARRAGGAGLSHAAGTPGVAPLGSARAVRWRAPRWRRLGPARSVVERKEQARRMSRQRGVSSTDRGPRAEARAEHGWLAAGSSSVQQPALRDFGLARPRFSPAPTASRPGVRPAGTRASASVT